MDVQTREIHKYKIPAESQSLALHFIFTEISTQVALPDVVRHIHSLHSMAWNEFTSRYLTAERSAKHYQTLAKCRHWWVRKQEEDAETSKKCRACLLFVWFGCHQSGTSCWRIDPLNSLAENENWESAENKARLKMGELTRFPYSRLILPDVTWYRRPALFLDQRPLQGLAWADGIASLHQYTRPQSRTLT